VWQKKIVTTSVESHTMTMYNKLCARPHNMPPPLYSTSGGDNWTTGAIIPAKLQSNHHHQNQHPVFLQAGCPSCRPTNSVKALKGKYHIPWTCLPQAHLWVFQLCLWALIAPGYLGEVCHASHQPSDASPCKCSCSSCIIPCVMPRKKKRI